MEQMPKREDVSQKDIEASPESIETLNQLKDFLAQGYLLHGSKQPIDTLEPRQAEDTNKERHIGRQHAVYATRHVEIPIFMALKDRKDDSIRSWRSGYSGTGGSWYMHGENTTLTPGYVYVLPPDTFERLEDERGGEELVSRVPVTPIAVFKVEPNILKLFPNITLDLK